jgi:hypothetical protein
MHVWRDEEMIEMHTEKTPADVCPDCLALEDWVRRVRLTWKCWRCGTEIIPADIPEGQPRPADPVSDLECLAEWSPTFEGSAVPLVAPIYLEDEHASGTLGRARVEGDMLDQQTMYLRSQHGGSSVDGRKDHVDEGTAEIRRALRTLKTLDQMVVHSDADRKAALILLFAFWWMGPRARDQWWQTTEPIIVHGVEGAEEYAAQIREYHRAIAHACPDMVLPEIRKEERLGLDWWVGMVCAAPDLRNTWLHQGKLGMAVARTSGSIRIREAVERYQHHAARLQHGTVRLSLASARDAIGQVTHDAMSDCKEACRYRVKEARSEHNAKLRALIEPSLSWQENTDQAV